MTDWFENHLEFRDTLRHRLAYGLGGDRLHDVVIRDGDGRELCHFVGRVPSVSMPPPPFQVWCCDGRIDDGHGRIRGVRGQQ